MTLWNKIVIGTKFLFVGFESATDYTLVLLNKYLSSGNIAERVQKAREYIDSCIAFLRKYQEFCPVRWVVDYDKLLRVLQTLSDVLADNKVTSEEIQKTIADAKAAIEEWMKN